MLVKGLDQARDVAPPVGVADLDGVSQGESLEVVGQIVLRDHLGALDEEGDDYLLLLQGGRDLAAHQVFRIIDSASPLTVGQGEPLFADDRDQDLARSQPLVDQIREVDTTLDAVDVHEDAVVAERSPELARQDCESGLVTHDDRD